MDWFVRKRIWDKNVRVYYYITCFFLAYIAKNELAEFQCLWSYWCYILEWIEEKNVVW